MNVLNDFIPDDTAQPSEDATIEMRKILEKVVRRLSRQEKETG